MQDRNVLYADVEIKFVFQFKHRYSLHLVTYFFFSLCQDDISFMYPVYVINVLVDFFITTDS
jgi:hypothetical protein